VASIIFGGGSIFHSDHDLRRYETWMLRARGGPRFAAGVSVGPFKTHTAETICSRILHAMAFVGVRDTASLERVRFLAPSARTELTFDIAPLLLTHVQPCEQSPPVGRELAISLCALRSDPPDPRWLSELTVSLSRLSRRALFDRVALVDFNAESFDSERSDRQLHLRLARALSGHVRVEHVPYAGNPRLIASRLEGASAVLAMRLHAAVFAYVMRKPCVVIRYHEKSTQWCREIGLPDSLSVDKNELVATELETMLEAALSFTPPRPTLPVEKAIERSLRNWTWMRGSIAGCPA
jgi:polysaccharide pyruvyl transferase WcaK-like protein